MLWQQNQPRSRLPRAGVDIAAGTVAVVALTDVMVVVIGLVLTEWEAEVVKVATISVLVHVESTVAFLCG